MFFDQYLLQCEKIGKRPYEVARELGCSNSNVAQWKKGSMPRPAMLKKIAEYFGVSVGYLVSGETEKKEIPTVGQDDGGLKGYEKLNEENRAFIDQMIAKLLASQSQD